MKAIKIKNINPLWKLIFFFILSIGISKADAQDCNGKYQCWVNKAFQSLKQQQFIEAADIFKAAQVCDDAPYPDTTILHLIDSAYQLNIKFINDEIAKGKDRIKDGKKQGIAYKITSKFIKTNNSDDLSLQLLLLHHACKTTNNSNKLAMDTRRDILSDTNNLFYSDVEMLNTLQEIDVRAVHKFSKDRKKHIIISENQVMIKYESEKPDVLIPLNEPIETSKSDLSADGKYLLIFTLYNDINNKKNTSKPQNRLSVFNTENGKVIPFYDKAIHTATFSHSGDSLLILTSEGRFILRGVMNNDKRETLSRHKIDSVQTVSCLTMTHNGKHFITGNKNGNIILWNINGKRIHIFPKRHYNRINTLLVSADDKQIISGSDDSTAIVWALEKSFIGNITSDIIGNSLVANMICHLEENKKQLSAVAFSSDANYIITGSYDKKAYLWDKKGKLIQSVLGHKSPLNAVSFSHDGQFFYTQDDASVKTWAFKLIKVPPIMNDFGIKDTFDFYDNSVMSPNKQSIFIKFSKKNQVKAIWKDKKGKEVSFEQNALKIYQPTFSPDSRLLCFQYGRDSLEIWLQNGQLLKTIKANGAITNISFSPDSRYLLINNKSKGSELYITEGFKKLKDFNVNPKKYNNVIFSPDSRYVMETQKDSVTIFDLENLKPIAHVKEAFRTNKGLKEAQFISVTKDAFLIMITNDSNHVELWRVKPQNERLFSLTNDTVTNIKSLHNGDYFYYETINNKSVIQQSKIRRASATGYVTVVATFPKPIDDFYFHKTPSDSSLLLYVLFDDNIYEVNLNEPSKNKDLEPAISFYTSNNYSTLMPSFSQSGDSIFIGNHIYPNALKLLNENKYVPPSILTLKNKREAGILTDEDCKGSKAVEVLCECALYYAQNATEDTAAYSQYEWFISNMKNNNDENLIDTYEQYLRDELLKIVDNPNFDENYLQKIAYTQRVFEIYEKVNNKDLVKTKMLWKDIQNIFIDKVGEMAYENNFPQKIAYTKKIIEIYEKDELQDVENKEERAIQYSNLSWYILMDTDPDKVQKALNYGQKAAALNPQDWIVANLGHAHLFNNNLDKAKECYTPLLYRYKDILKDLDIFEKAGAIPPQLKEIREWVEQEGVKKTQ